MTLPEDQPPPAKPYHWHLLPIALVLGGVLACEVAALANAAALGWWQVPVYIGGLAALGAIFWFRRELTASEVELDALRATFAQQNADLAEQERRLKANEREFQTQVQQQIGKLDKREQALAERFVAFHEWMEFPTPLDLRQEEHHLPQQPDHELTDAELADLAKKDRQMLELLQAESKVLFENIVQNRYQPEGKFQPLLVRDDVLQLVKKVAQVYNQAAQQPLLETSLEQVLRAASRASLHCLVVLDELPLNVKPYNIASLYSYIRQGVLAFNSYKAAEPYWQYANTAWFLGRLALGANPITLGAWWFLGSLGRQGARAITTHLVNRHALALLGSFVRVIGYEVAGIYGGDFRHRDANWIYAVELCELLKSFPLSRDSLAHALREIGALQLRSEYDRVFLYRCVAEQVSAQPARWRASVCLSGEERRAIAGRLEKFLTGFIHGKSPTKVEQWKQGVEERLAVKIVVNAAGPTLNVSDQRRDGVRSLASFLIGVKQHEPAELETLLVASRLFRSFTPEERKALLASLTESPPFFFEQPDLDPDGEPANEFLQDLAALHARVAPRDSQIDTTIMDVGAFLRREPEQTQQVLTQALLAHLAERLPFDAPVKRVPAAAARAALDLLEPAEKGLFFYSGVTLEPAPRPGSPIAKSSLWLLGVSGRAILFAADGGQPLVVWRGEPTSVQVEVISNLLQKSAVVRGGTWLIDSIPPGTTLRVPCPLMTSSSTWLKPLVDWATRTIELAAGTGGRGK